MELPPKILGLAGTFASGKDTIAAWLNQKHGYYHTSTGDMVREIANARHGNIDRPTLNKTANKLRAERGGGVLVELAFEHYEPIEKQYPGGLIINGVRSIGEAKAVKKRGGYLLFIDAPTKMRYKRLKDRARGDEATLDYKEFVKREEKEMTPKVSADENVQNVAGVQAMADATVINSHELEQFIDDIRQILNLPSADNIN